MVNVVRNVEHLQQSILQESNLFKKKKKIGKEERGLNQDLCKATVRTFLNIHNPHVHNYLSDFCKISKCYSLCF